jgi:type VI secretion system ImpM family protein
MSSGAVGRWLYGKLPVLGDFVSRGIGHAQRDALDIWLSEEMLTARERFGDDFEERYDRAPAWCFVDRDADGRWSGGAMCASVDAVGRRYPILVSCPADDAGAAPGVAAGCLEDLYRAFGDGWDADRLMSAEAGTVAVGWQAAEPAWVLVGEDGPCVELAGSFPRGVVSKMLERAL